MGKIDYNILFRWLVWLNLHDAVWNATVVMRQNSPRI
jgi:hypothetical protein